MLEHHRDREPITVLIDERGGAVGHALHLDYVSEVNGEGDGVRESVCNVNTVIGDGGNYYVGVFVYFKVLPVVRLVLAGSTHA